METQKDIARSLRKTSTPAEVRFWNVVRGQQLNGLKFRRQEPLGPYIVDFMCASVKLVIELDGDVHADPEVAAKDRARQAWLESEGWRVIRFTNLEVKESLPDILEEVWREALALDPTLA